MYLHPKICVNVVFATYCSNFLFSCEQESQGQRYKNLQMINAVALADGTLFAFKFDQTLKLRVKHEQIIKWSSK